MISTRVGYSGGTKEKPSYYDLGDHTEVIQIDYDPSKISFSDLVDIFWQGHSPDIDIKHRQYMSILFYHNDRQYISAMESKDFIEKSINQRIYTHIMPMEKFYLAEGYHQKYYIQLIKLFTEHFKDIYPKTNDFINSTAVARINGYLKGYGSISRLEKEKESFRLPKRLEDRLFEIVEGYGR